MRRTLSILALAVMALTLPVQAQEPVDTQPPAHFSHSAPVLLAQGGEEYLSIEVSPPLYAVCRPGLPDLRLVDQSGEDIPYVLTGDELGQDTKETFPLSLVEEYEKDGDSYAIYELPQTGANRDVLLTSLSLDIDGAGYAKQVTVSGSHDAEVWETVAATPIYSVDGNAANTISLGDERRYKFYRLRIPNNRERIRITGVTGVRTVRLLNPRQTRLLDAQYTVEQAGKQTLVHITNARGLPLVSVELVTDSMFQREVRLMGGAADMLYNLEFAGVPLQSTVLPVGGAAYSSDDVVLSIENLDDKPIDIQGVVLEYQAAQLVFPARGIVEAALLFGNAEVQRPHYDIEQYRTRVLEQPIGVCTLGEIAELPEKPAPKPGIDFSMVFTISVVAAAIVAGFIILNQLRKKPTGGADGM